MDFETQTNNRMHARRDFLSVLSAAAGMLVATLTGVALPIRAWATERNRPAFDAKAIADSLKGIGATNALESSEIILKSPDIAENSAIVHIEVQSKLPDTQTIYVLAEKNPQPLAAQFDLMPGVDAYVSVRIKMAESAFIRVVVKAGGKLYFTRKETKVTLGGCAG